MNVCGVAAAAALLAAGRMPSSFDTASLSPVIERMGWTLVHFTWEGLLVAALLAVAMRAMRGQSSAARYGVSCLAMAVLVVLPVGTFFLVTSTSTIWVDTDALTRRALLAGTEADLADAGQLSEHSTLSAPPQPQPYPLLPPLERLRTAFPWLVGAWAGGVALLALWHVVGWLRVRALCRRDVRSMGEAWGTLLEEAAERLGVRRAVTLLESTRAKVPMVMGCLRPVILLPASAVSGLTIAQLEAILAHELAHVRRFDYLVNLIQVAAETLLFYHPAVWWVSGRIRIEREHCCDDLAAAATPGGAVAYARALAKLEELRMPTLPHDPLRLVPAATTGSLLNRVRRLLGHGENGGAPDRDDTATPHSRPVAAAVLVAAAIAAGALTPFVHLPGAVAADTASSTADVTAEKDKEADATAAKAATPSATSAAADVKAEEKPAPKRDEEPARQASLDKLQSYKRAVQEAEDTLLKAKAEYATRDDKDRAYQELLKAEGNAKELQSVYERQVKEVEALAVPALKSDAPAPAKPAAPDAPGERPLNVEDVIRVTVVDPAKPDADGKKIATVRIDQNGQIRLPQVGTIPAAGLTAAKLEAQIKQRYGPEGVNLSNFAPNERYTVTYAPPGEEPDADVQPGNKSLRVEANGNGVRVTNGNFRLEANSVTLDAPNKIVSADGQAVITKLDGNVTKLADVKGDLATNVQAVITQIDGNVLKLDDVRDELQIETTELKNEIGLELAPAGAADVAPKGVTRLEARRNEDDDNDEGPTATVDFKLQKDIDTSIEFTDTPDASADKKPDKPSKANKPGKPDRPRKAKVNPDGKPTPDNPAAIEKRNPDENATPSADDKQATVLEKLPYVGRLFENTAQQHAQAAKAAEQQAVAAERAARDAKAQSAKAQLADIEAELSKLRSELGDEHPKLKALQGERDHLMTALKELSAADASSANKVKVYRYRAGIGPQEKSFQLSPATPEKLDKAGTQYRLSARLWSAQNGNQIAEGEQKLAKMKDLVNSGYAPKAELEKAQRDLDQAKAELARVKSDWDRKRHDEAAAAKNDPFGNNFTPAAPRASSSGDGRNEADFERDLARRKLEVLNEELVRADVERAKAQAMAAQQADKQKAEAQLKALEVQREQLRSAYEEQAKVAAEMENRRAEMQRHQQEMMKRMEVERRDMVAKQEAIAREAQEAARRAQAEAVRARDEAMTKEADAKTRQREAASGEYFISGVPQAGSRPVRTGGRSITLLQALVAGGFDPAKSRGSEVVLVRQPGDANSAVQRESIPVDDVIEGKQRPLQSGDVILVRPAGGERGNGEPARR